MYLTLTNMKNSSFSISSSILRHHQSDNRDDRLKSLHYHFTIATVLATTPDESIRYIYFLGCYCCLSLVEIVQVVAINMAQQVTNYMEIQRDEIEALRSIYMEDFEEEEIKTGAWNVGDSISNL